MNCEMFPGFSGEAPRERVFGGEASYQRAIERLNELTARRALGNGHAGTIEGALAQSQPVARDVFTIPSNVHVVRQYPETPVLPVAPSSAPVPQRRYIETTLKHYRR